MDIHTDYLRPRSIECCRNIIKVMKKYGYYVSIMELSSKADRVKKFLQLLENRSPADISDVDNTAVNPRILPIFPGIYNKFVHSSEQFPYLKILEENYQTIRDEALSLDNQNDYIDYGSNFMGKGNWAIHIFSYMGVKIEKNCMQCPKTASILNSLPNRCQIYPWGDAVFSVLQPGAHIPAHTSFDNLRMRCMFGVDVPPGCEMRVGNLLTHWENGKSLLFEDSFEHEVWNRGSLRRIVLIFDFWHPDLTPYEIELITIAFTHPAVREIIYDALRNSTEAYNQYLQLAKVKHIPVKNFNHYWKKTMNSHAGE